MDVIDVAYAHQLLRTTIVGLFFPHNLILKWREHADCNNGEILQTPLCSYLKISHWYEMNP